ncbi:MAG TPA: sigma-70 family RNA polymerase sigma factor [Ktedonobacterales bacterium]
MNHASAPGGRLTEAEFTAWCEHCQWPLYTFLRGIGGEDETARDLLQETLLRAWRAAQAGAPPFDDARDEVGMRRWLFHVAYTRAISDRRHRRVFQWQPLAESDVEPADPADVAPFEDAIAESQAMRAALAALAPADAACLMLIVVQGFTAAETAAIVGGTPQAIAKRFARAKQRLRAVYLAQNVQFAGGSQP